MKCRNIILIILITILLVPTAYAQESEPTDWWDEFVDFFFSLWGVEPSLYFDIDNHDILGDTQEYILKTSIAEKDFDYEVKVLSKKANINTWLEYYQETTCERQVIDKIVLDPLNLTEGGTKTIYKTEYYDCSGWTRATKEETRTKLLSDNEFTKVRVMREWGEMPKENCVEYELYTRCEQKVDIIIDFGGRKYIEYAQFLQTSSSWNGVYSRTEESGGKIILSSDEGIEGTYLGFLFATNGTGLTALATNGTHFFSSHGPTQNIMVHTIDGEFVYDFPIEASDDPQGVCVNETNIWNVESSNDEVYLYDMAGNYLSSWDTAGAGSNTPRGCYQNGTAFFITDSGNFNLYEYTMGGTLVATYNLSHSGNGPYGVYTNNTNIWIQDRKAGAGENQSVAKYTMGLVFVSQWSLDANNTNSYGLAAYGNFWYVPDDDDEGIHYYEREGIAADGNFTLVGLGNDTSSNWNEIEWNTIGTDLASMECRSSDDNSSWDSYVSKTNGVDMGIDNKKYLQCRANLDASDTQLEYINISYGVISPPTSATNLKINATTDNNYTTDDVYAEFRVGNALGGGAVIYNITWYKNGLLNVTYGNLTNSTEITLEILGSENTTIRDDWAFSIITCDIPDYLCGDEIFSANVTIRSIPPTTPTINIPANNTQSGNSSIRLNCSNSTDLDGDTIYYEFYVDANNPPTTQVNNTEYGWHNYTTDGDFWYRCRANDSTEYSAYTDPIYFQMNRLRIINATLNYSETVYETASHNYNTTVTINKWNVEDITAVLEYNNTNYTATKTAGISNDDLAVFTFDKTLQTQLLGDVTLTGIWHFTLDMLDGTTELNSSYTFTNEVKKIELAECNETFTNPFINFTFKDEDTDEYMNASIKSSTFNYSLDSARALTKAFSFVKNVDNFSYAFCFEPLNQTLHTNIDLDYDSEGYPQRSYSESLSLTNTTTNQVLLLVASGDGIYVTFQVINIAEQPISDVNVNITRTIGGTTYVIESGETGDDGGFTTWLNPDLTYTATFIKEDYDTYTTSQKFTQSSYTITLGGVAVDVEVNVTSYVQGVEYSVEPTIDVLLNNTDYNFNFTTISTHWSLSESGFTLTNLTDGVLGSASCSTDVGCISSAIVNTVNNTEINMNYYWIIDGVYSNGTRSWTVYVTKQDERRGAFQNLISDVDKLGSGFNDFTKAIIAFFIILFVVGTISYYSGVYSTMAIMVEVFFLVGFLDMVGFIPTVGIDHFITVLIGLMCVGYFIYEYTR